MVRHARLVARHAERVMSADVDRLREVGLDDGAVFDVTAAAAARAFLTKLIDDLGAEPDAVYADLDSQLLETMVVGPAVSAKAARG